ncbi:putative tat pathway signal sequence domain protein [Phaeoacremonium minimum UCRPA7]|uniref:Putative tat pathway signal sequence domain protein n=1 Tax=Phaeoacremonium minimum (strain UCR-PA7) TaxID=1286976 RepID=R8BAJ9_PHAM7|nr:putative tat pathway signal sequence domain protein [Phaeoacremonium minimum UCRPA7]EON96328.1 putative tat pathway signal sequence domain protein [Phaeoacremonium minimum UCRPA7]
MASTTGIQTYQVPEGIDANDTFVVKARIVKQDGAAGVWAPVPAYAVDVADVNITCNQFNKHPIAVASLDIEQSPIEIKAQYRGGEVTVATIRPLSLGIKATIEKDNTITFRLDHPHDVMLEINNDKWQALHVLTDDIDVNAPKEDSDNVWYFGPGVNNGSAYKKVVDGNLMVPSDTTVYLDSGAFITAKLNFIDVSNSGVRGHGFIYKGPNGGAILIERSNNIFVEKVTSLGATGFSLTTGKAKGVHIDGYRSFSSHGNGDGVDFFCSQDVLVENCFLRNSDDTVAIYGHRWDYYGDTKNITVRNCTLLPDIAHPIHMGTHGNPAKPETFTNIRISNLDILDHYENQTWYQGCVSINAGDENLIEDVLVEDVRVEKISKGQLVNIRVMQNPMWTTAPGRGVRNVTIKNVTLDTDNSVIVYPSQILGFDAERKVEHITFENLKIGGEYVHDGMPKPRWYTVADLVPMFVNEHAKNIAFKLSEGI